jgi:hypothetical protein
MTEKASLKGAAVRGQSFSLDLENVPVAATPQETAPPHPEQRLTPQGSEGTTTLEVLSPLRFTASYPAEKLVYRIKRAVDLYGGRIHLGKKAGHTWLGVRDNGLLLSLQSSLGVEVKQAVIVPCSALELGNGTPYESPLAVMPPAGRRIGTGTSYVPLHLTPGEGDPLDLRFAGPFQVLRRRPGWALLRADWEDGSWVRGWTPDPFPTAEAAEPRSWTEGAGTEQGCGSSDRPLLVRVTLRKDAPVAASPGGEVWARVARKIGVEAFPLDRRDAWIQVAAVPGLPVKACSEHEHLWVHSRDLVGPVPRSHGHAQ